MVVLPGTAARAEELVQAKAKIINEPNHLVPLDIFPPVVDLPTARHLEA
jgi:hypothetical protein